ncbi:hypothetical protein ACE6H2_015720 [Prunus campanulata]
MRNVGFPIWSGRSRRMSRCDNNNKNIDSLPFKFQERYIRDLLPICITHAEYDTHATAQTCGNFEFDK